MGFDSNASAVGVGMASGYLNSLGKPITITLGDSSTTHSVDKFFLAGLFALALVLRCSAGANSEAVQGVMDASGCLLTKRITEVHLWRPLLGVNDVIT